MKRPYGMTTRAFNAYIVAMDSAGIDPETTSLGTRRVVQTIGTAVASAGTHGEDGHGTDGKPYTCALDLSVKGLTKKAIERVLIELWKQGFCAWYRSAPEFPGNLHIHAIFSAHPMKRSLRNQVHSFLKHRSGLVSDKADAFVAENLTEAMEQKIRENFLAVNPAKG